MTEKEFSLRLAQLRSEKGVSARDMSLSIGQNASYINNIENGKALPSMTGFFYICEYLNITPGEFFDAENKNPEKIQEVVENLKKLDSEQLDNISAIIRDLAKYQKARLYIAAPFHIHLIPSRLLTVTLKHLLNAIISISVTNLSPDSIRWTAFLLISRPTTCNLSESSRCEIWSALRSSFTLSPDMLLRPSAVLALNILSTSR